jgi:hypothetical protein
MSLRFPYKLDPVPRPVLSLGGRYVRPRPVVPVTLVGPTGGRARDAMLDTGGDNTLFPEELAAKIGLDLTNAPKGTGAGVGSTGVEVRYVQVTLRLTDGKERREWIGWVGFTKAPLPYPLLGFAGCLQFFTSTYHGDREEVELTTNSLYPGT